MHDTYHTMMLMIKYGGSQSTSGQKESVRDDDGMTRKSKSTKNIANYFDYFGAVDSHNAKRYDGGSEYGINIEETW